MTTILRPKEHLKAAFLGVFLVACSISKPAFAYIDPVSGSLIFQALLAIFVGAGFAIKKFYKRIIAFFTGNSADPSIEESDSPPADKAD